MFKILMQTGKTFLSLVVVVLFTPVYLLLVLMDVAERVKNKRSAKHRGAEQLRYQRRKQHNLEISKEFV